MKINSADWYPCYLNPSFDEILELARSGWDTCRILVPYHDERHKDIVIASGYGNTHNSIQNRYFIHLGAVPIEENGVIRRWRYKSRLPMMWSSILFHQDGVAYMNLEDVGGTQYDRISKWDFDADHLEIIKDLVRESNLSL